MIEWYWAVITLVIGVIFGITICGLVSVNSKDEHKNWWEE